MTVQIKLRRKYRRPVAKTIRLQGAGDSGRKRHKLGGPRTYDPRRHMMIVDGNTGKKRMIHL